MANNRNGWDNSASLAATSTPRRPTQCTIGYRYYDVGHNAMLVGRQVPSLRLHGLWLEGLGFALGSKVRHDGQCALLITAVPDVRHAIRKKRSSKPSP